MKKRTPSFYKDPQSGTVYPMNRAARGMYGIRSKKPLIQPCVGSWEKWFKERGIRMRGITE